MSIKIEFTGYVQDVKSGVSATTGKPWALAKVVHNQVKRNADDTGWENVGKDYLDVFLPSGVMVDKDDRIDVVGRLKTSTYEKQDGTKGISLSVNAETVAKSPAFAKSTPAPKAEVPDSWTPVDDTELPF